MSKDLASGPIAEHYASLQDYTPIDSLTEHGTFHDLIAIVCSFAEIKPTKGPDMQRSMVVCDPSASMPSSGIMVQFYKPRVEDLPKPVSGSIIVLERFKLFNYRGTCQAWSNNMSSWTVYDANGKDILNSFPGGHEKDAETKEYIRRLAGWWKTRSGGSVSKELQVPGNVNSISSHSTKRATVTLRQVKESMFFDIYGFIVKTFPSRDNAFTIYLTDYTSNNQLHDYKYGEARWPGPFGQQTMQITLWDAHAFYAHAHIHENSFVYLRNVLGKMNNAGRLEGTLRGDRMHPGRVNVTVISSTDPLVKNIKLRKAQSQVQWRLEKERLEEEMMLAAQAERSRQMTPPPSVNPNLQTSYSQVPSTPIGDILEPPFVSQAERKEGPGARRVPRKYRTVGRIVDFWPTDLRDFARPFCMACQSTYAPKNPEYQASLHATKEVEDICTMCGAVRDLGDPDTYEFAFTILVEGQDCVAIPVIFSGDDVETLFSDEQLVPCNLYLPRNQSMLSRLREKLFLLWGALEEDYEAPVKKKRKDDSSKHELREEPLMWNELCIMEYWVNEFGGEAGWNGRRFRGFGMRIV